MYFKWNIYFSSGNVLIGLLFILVLFDYFLFYSFQTMYPQLTLNAQIFNFLGSKTFELVTISIGLPILLFLVDYIFKFREKYAEDKKKRQMDSFNQTRELWADISKLFSKFFNIEPENFKNNEKTKELKEEIAELKIRASLVVNSWIFEFSDLENNNTEGTIPVNKLFLLPINVLLSSLSFSIKYNRLNKQEIEKIKRLTGYIMLIYVGIKGNVYHRSLRIMNNFMLFSENPEEKYKNKIDSNIQDLKTFNKGLISEMYNFYPFTGFDKDFKEIYDYLVEMKIMIMVYLRKDLGLFTINYLKKKEPA